MTNQKEERADVAANPFRRAAGATPMPIVYTAPPHPVLREADLAWFRDHGSVLRDPAVQPDTIALIVVDYLSALGYTITPLDDADAPGTTDRAGEAAT